MTTTWEQKWRESAERRAAERARRIRQARNAATAARAAVVPVAGEDTDLVIALVQHVDRRHDSFADHCFPRVPQDCLASCGACATLRAVRDDILRAARAQTALERTQG